MRILNFYPEMKCRIAVTCTQKLKCECASIFFVICMDVSILCTPLILESHGDFRHELRSHYITAREE